MNYVRIYIGRTFSRNFKKQFFLILGIAAFMVLLSMHIMISDSNAHNWKDSLENRDWGFSSKVFDVPGSLVDYMESYEGVERVEAVEKIKLIGGISGAKDIISSAVPGSWKLHYLYGQAPEKGEILLTETALIGNRQPIPGETVRLEIQTEEKRQQIEMVVSGVVEAFYDFTGTYAFLCPEDFEILAGKISLEEKRYDVFYTEKEAELNANPEKEIEFYEKLGAYRNSGWGHAGEEINYNWGNILSGILIATIFGGACIGAVIYMVLQDEKKNIGIMRALGAKKLQIAGMVTARMLVSGTIGILIGSMLSFGAVLFQKKVLYTDTVLGGHMGWESAAAIPVAGLVLLLVLQIPGIYVLLRETPVSLMSELKHIGENLISLHGEKVMYVKRPVWWYAGLERKRLRGRHAGLIVITVLSMVLPMVHLLSLRYNLQENIRDAQEETYTVEKGTGFFTEEEIMRIIEMSGFSSAGFPVEQSGVGIAEYEGRAVRVQLQILDESSFRKMKLDCEKAGRIVLEESGMELLKENKILVRQTLDTVRKRVEQGDRMRLFSPDGQSYDCEIALVGQNGGETGVDYYLFISFSQYCKVFGIPELQSFSVTLNGITLEKAGKRLLQEIEGASIVQNIILLGNTEEELDRDAWMTAVLLVFLSFLSAVTFLICYYSFYYLAKTEEYRKLFAMGASKKILKSIMLSQSFRNSLVVAFFSAVMGYILYYVNNRYIDQWLLESVPVVPVAELTVLIVFVIGISLGATWFASGQVLKELEQKE